ncbi:MAG TPA: RNA methyltransferase [Clostridiales bacterium]|nr:RNA methyltransferase [Clostridiales bacterium]HBW05484.1 RNA methyltransferase [Clostridiales bacterium]
MDSIFDGKLNIEVAVASGIEAVCKRELLRLGYNPSGANFGRIEFEGDYKDVLRANVFLRTANRVRIVLAKFKAETFDELFDGIFAMRWQDVVTRDSRIIVNAKSQSSKLFALRSIQSISKKAIISKLASTLGGSFDESGAVYDVEVSLCGDVATVTLDTSGEGLHKRGYRTYLGDAPIRETLAAAMIELSVWNPDRAFIDPFCGSGTIPIEAALIGLNIAPCMNRNFACESFKNAPNVRELVQQEAQDSIRDRVLYISGFDINKDAIKLAQKHAERAGVKDKIHLQVGDMRDISSRFSHGVIVTNPPYGERLMDEAELKVLYRDFGAMTRKLDEWCVYAITSYRAFEKYFGARADKVRKLYNSELECNFYQYLAAPPKKNDKPKEPCDKRI